VLRIAVFVHTHSDPDTGDLHCMDGFALETAEVTCRDDFFFLRGTSPDFSS
jgi:hypothetical protein